MKCFICSVCCLLVFSFNGSLLAQELDFLSPVTFYAGQEHSLTLQARNLKGKTLKWTLRYLERTVQAGELVIPENGQISLRFKFPKLNPGVIASCVLNVLVNNQESIRKTLYFYPQNPFTDIKNILKKRNISFWDASENQALKKILRKFSIPATEIDNFEAFQGGVLVVSGIDFWQFSNLEETWRNVVTSGAEIIVFAPVQGELILNLSAYKEFSFADSNIIKRFSVKFDTEKWGAESLNTSVLELKPSDPQINLAVTKKNTGFSFCRMRAGKGEIIITTWKVPELAEKSPTPLYILKKMLLKE